MHERLKRAQTGTAGAQIAGRSFISRPSASIIRPSSPRSTSPRSAEDTDLRPTTARSVTLLPSPAAVWPTRWMDRDAESAPSVVCLPVGRDSVRRADVLMRICLLRLVVDACAVVHLRSETLRRRPLHFVSFTPSERPPVSFAPISAFRHFSRLMRRRALATMRRFIRALQNYTRAATSA